MKNVNPVWLSWLASVALAILPAFCAVASSARVTTWVDEMLQPTMLAVSRSRSSWYLKVIVDLL
ncbi:hypothetical protein D3C75_1247980 [compost metagenome]